MKTRTELPGARTVFRNGRAEWRFVYYHPGERMAPHRHDCAQFSLMLTGGQRESARGHSVETHAMAMALKPRSFHHDNEFGGDGSLMLSVNLFDADDEDRPFDFGRWRVRDAYGVAAEWRALAAAMSAAAPDEDTLDDLTDDLLAAMLDADGAPERAAPPLWLARARDAAAQTQMTAEEIAKDAGVHRVHLSRAFRRHYGVSLSEHRRRTRLARAATALIRDHAAPARAGSDAGFADQPHLTRDLRRETGLTPAALSRLFSA